MKRGHQNSMCDTVCALLLLLLKSSLVFITIVPIIHLRHIICHYGLADRFLTIKKSIPNLLQATCTTGTCSEDIFGYLANRTAHSKIGYWHDSVVGLSICL